MVPGTYSGTTMQASIHWTMAIASMAGRSSGSRVLSVAGAFPRSFPAKTAAIRAYGSLAIHRIRVWHTRALENLAGPFRSVHPLALGWEGWSYVE
jgi:hypothetical protein